MSITNVLIEENNYKVNFNSDDGSLNVLKYLRFLIQIYLKKYISSGNECNFFCWYKRYIQFLNNFSQNVENELH